jgi:hypothetical protein
MQSCYVNDTVQSSYELIPIRPGQDLIPSIQFFSDPHTGLETKIVVRVPVEMVAKPVISWLKMKSMLNNHFSDITSFEIDMLNSILHTTPIVCVSSKADPTSSESSKKIAILYNPALSAYAKNLLSMF